MSAHNNGGTTDYYALPLPTHEKIKSYIIAIKQENMGIDFATKQIILLCPQTLNDLIDHAKMSWNIANIFKACYRFGKKDNATKIYDLNKIIYYANRELNLVQQEEASKPIQKLNISTDTIWTE